MEDSIANFVPAIVSYITLAVGSFVGSITCETMMELSAEYNGKKESSMEEVVRLELECAAGTRRRING